MRAVLDDLADVDDADADDPTASVPERHAQLFRQGQSISGFAPVGGNSAWLTDDSNSAIDAIVADIDAGQRVFDSAGIGYPGGTGHMQRLRLVYRFAALAGEKLHRPCRSTGIRTSLRRINQSVNGGLYLAKMGSPTGLSPRSRISDRSLFSFIS